MEASVDQNAMSEGNNVDPTDETDERTNTINRRNLMKTIGAAGGTVGFGILSTNKGSAKQIAGSPSTADIEKVKAARQSYTASQAAENAILTEGEQLLEELKNRNIIKSETELDTAKFTPKKEYAETREGMGMTSFISNGVPTAHIYTSKKLQNQHLSVVVEPQLQRSFAILRPSADDQKNVVTIDASGDDTVTYGAQSVVCTDKYDLSDGSAVDPTPKDNCWLDGETYWRYIYSDGSCSLGDFISCNPLGSVYLDCNNCSG